MTILLTNYMKGKRMKLRNKKTGEIVDLDIANIKAQFGGISVIPKPHIIQGEEYVYNSLAELCGEWEDYEEPKEYWYINEWGNIEDTDYKNDKYDNAAKEIGNYFSSEEEAELAVRRLQAWKRLKDAGFKFDGISGNCIKYIIDVSKISSSKEKDELNEYARLLFGGEE